MLSCMVLHDFKQEYIYIYVCVCVRICVCVLRIEYIHYVLLENTI